MPVALPLLAAGGSIFAGISAGGLIGGAMIAGGALTGIGALTKNQKLMKIGGLVSLAGGVAGLATGAFAATAETLASQTAQEAFRAAELAATGATNAAMGGVEAAAGAAGGAVADAGLIGSGVTGTAQPTGLVSEAFRAPASTVAASEAASAGAPLNTAQEGFRASELAASRAPAGAAGVPAQSVSSWGDRVGQVSDWMRSNKDIVNVGAGIVGGAMKNASEQDLMRERWAAEDAALAKRRQQISDSVRGLKVGTFVPPGG